MGCGQWYLCEYYSNTNNENRFCCTAMEKRLRQREKTEKLWPAIDRIHAAYDAATFSLHSISVAWKKYSTEEKRQSYHSKRSNNISIKLKNELPPKISVDRDRRKQIHFHMHSTSLISIMLMYYDTNICIQYNTLHITYYNRTYVSLFFQ